VNKQLSFLILILSVLVACKRKEVMQKEVLGLKKMKIVMYDLILAESLQEIRPVDYPLGDISLRDHVLKSHGLNKTSFQKSLDYYQQHPQLYKQLADSLAAYSSTQTAHILQEPAKSYLNGHNITDSSGPLRNFKGDR
jgi:hypothetical protein